MAQDTVVIADFNDAQEAQRFLDLLNDAGLQPKLTGGGPQSVQEGTSMSSQGRFQVRVPVAYEEAAREFTRK